MKNLRSHRGQVFSPGVAEEQLEHQNRTLDHRYGKLHRARMILTAGLKVQPWATPAKDAQLAELMRLSAERICRAYGIPLQLLGLGGAPFSTTEALMRFWLSTGLGFALAIVEQAFDRLFGLEGEPEDYTEFSTDALPRSDPKDRIEMLARGVQSGIYSPNERAGSGDSSFGRLSHPDRTISTISASRRNGLIPRRRRARGRRLADAQR